MRLDESPRIPFETDPRLRQELTLSLRNTAVKVNQLASGLIAGNDNTATSVPTTGTWKQGDFVKNSSPTLSGSATDKYVVSGWIRLTDGAGNTLGTDWVEARASSDTVYGWHDVLGAVLTRGVGATDPEWAQIGSGPFYAYKFAVNDVMWINYHIPHDYATATDVYVHVHWISSGTDTASVKWQIDYMYAKGHNQGNYDPAGTTVNAEQSPPGTAYRHMVTESSAITISGLEPDGIIYAKVSRVTNGGTDNADDIFVLTADLHYQSTNISTLNRAPDFYA